MAEEMMIGLRTQESDDFISYMEIVQSFAKEEHCVFFLDCSEGNERVIDGINCEDLSGWLIPDSLTDEFKYVFESFAIDEKWNKYFRFVFWKLEDASIQIEFKEF